MKRMNIIGCGKVAKTLACLIHQHCPQIKIESVYNRKLYQAQQSVAFIGSGTPVNQLAQLKPADIYLLAVSDDQIESVALLLAELDLLKTGDIVFHCSGLKTATILHCCKKAGAWIASLHPVFSFADPAKAISCFQSSYCGLEGDAAAINYLKTLVKKIGAKPFEVNAEHKTIYHVGSVFIANYLVSLLTVFANDFKDYEYSIEHMTAYLEDLIKKLKTLRHSSAALLLTRDVAREKMEKLIVGQDPFFFELNHYFNQYDFIFLKNTDVLLSQVSFFGTSVCSNKEDFLMQVLNFSFADYFFKLIDIGFRCYEKSGVPPKKMLSIALPLLHSVIYNVKTVGIKHALTGPVARGDVATINQHYFALSNFDKDIKYIYQLFCDYTIRIQNLN